MTTPAARSLFTTAALRGHSPGNYRNFLRITAWLVVSCVFWIAGAFAEAEMRLALWAAALAIEPVSPSLGFWTPGLGRSTPPTGMSRVATWPSAAACS
jgi:low temperature requirement protein LtrA